MDKLYHKIYEAINNGIQKALILKDDQFDDVSVRWYEKEMDGSINIVPFYISEILAGNDILQNYENILNAYHNIKEPYKAHDIMELNRIYNAIKGFTDNIDLTWIDTSNALQVFSQYSENEKYSLHQFNKAVFCQCDLIKFGKIDNPLYIYRFDRLPSFDACQWHSDQIKNEIANYEWVFCSDRCIENNVITDMTDLNGYGHTYDNQNIDYSSVFRIDEYPAIATIINDAQIDNKLFMPYLPAISELLICSEYQDLINYVFDLMGNTDKLLNLNDGNIKYWSSTELYKYHAWYFGGIASYQNKTEEELVLPLFKKINE